MTIKKHHLLIIFIVLALVQLLVPLSMAWKWETVLKEGEPYYFETMPVDPYDAYRGRYITLNFKSRKAPLAGDTLTNQLEAGQPVYAILEQGEDGLANIREVSAHRPLYHPYVEAEFSYHEKKTELVNVRLPFDRYYMPEDLAPKAETELARRGTKQPAQALVRIKDGYGVIEQIYVDGQPLLEYLRR